MRTFLLWSDTSNYLLAHHPERCISVTLGGAGWKKPDNDPLGMMHVLAESLEAGKGIRPLLERLNSKGRTRMSPQQINMVNGTVMLFNDQKALAACVRGMAELSVLESELLANKVPTLALIGADDPLKQGVDELAKVMPKLTVKVFDDCDHVTCCFIPKFVTELKVFLAANSQTPATDR